MLASDDSQPAPGATDEGQFVQGKWIILAVISLGVAASIGSWVYYARLQQRPIALWGPRAAELMLRASSARAYRLEPATAEQGGAAERHFTINGAPYVVAAERLVSQAPGFSHIRQGLVHDRSFAWGEGPCDERAQWEYALDFEDRGDAAIVVFDFRCARAALLGGEHSASIRPVAAAVEGFLREQFPDADRTPPAH
jgi:hypothetical protein